MRLHTTIVSYQRLANLQETVATYLATVSVPFTLVVVDNGSDEDVTGWLRQSGRQLLLLGRNYYPGYACNRGWELAPADATYLHRSDSDIEYLPGWCEEAERVFAADADVGQVGLYTADWERSGGNVAGTMIIRRRLWDEGIRHREDPWKGPVTEDYWFSADVKRMGYRWARVERPCIIHKASGDLEDPYYRHSYGVRGIT